MPLTVCHSPIAQQPGWRAFPSATRPTVRPSVALEPPLAACGTWMRAYGDPPCLRLRRATREGDTHTHTQLELVGGRRHAVKSCCSPPRALRSPQCRPLLVVASPIVSGVARHAVSRSRALLCVGQLERERGRRKEDEPPRGGCHAAAAAPRPAAAGEVLTTLGVMAYEWRQRQWQLGRAMRRRSPRQLWTTPAWRRKARCGVPRSGGDAVGVCWLFFSMRERMLPRICFLGPGPKETTLRPSHHPPVVPRLCCSAAPQRQNRSLPYHPTHTRPHSRQHHQHPILRSLLVRGLDTKAQTQQQHHRAMRARPIHSAD